MCGSANATSWGTMLGALEAGELDSAQLWAVPEHRLHGSRVEDVQQRLKARGWASYCVHRQKGEERGHRLRVAEGQTGVWPGRGVLWAGCHLVDR